jgi:hypothetical protein
MVLVQLLVTSATNNRYYTVPISGKCSIQVLSMVYHSSEANTNSRVISLESDVLIAPYSPLRYITMVSNPQGTLNYDSNVREYNFQNAVVNGQILLNLVEYSTKASPPGTWHLLLSLEIECINKEFSPDPPSAAPSSRM